MDIRWHGTIQSSLVPSSFSAFYRTLSGPTTFRDPRDRFDASRCPTRDTRRVAATGPCSLGEAMPGDFGWFVIGAVRSERRPLLQCGGSRTLLDLVTRESRGTTVVGRACGRS